MITSGNGLTAGVARQLFMQWAEDARNLVMFTGVLSVATRASWRESYSHGVCFGRQTVPR